MNASDFSDLYNCLVAVLATNMVHGEEIGSLGFLRFRDNVFLGLSREHKCCQDKTSTVS